jgi:hypothetical protein
MATTSDPPGGPARAADAAVIEQPAHPPGGPEGPAPNGEAPRYRRGWVIGLVALLVGAGAGAAVGLSTTGTPKAKTVTAPAQTIVHTVAGPTKTIAQVHTVAGPTRTVTATVTRAVQASTPAPSAQPSGPTGGGGNGNTFSGDGSQNLGTITVPSDSTLYWQCDSCSSMDISSQTNSDGNSIAISSSATSGQSPISAGTYNNVQVSTDAAFTIAIK